tara:strand:- start:719 stop:952 length:234 start_codon:yes stop_codon:yes gene_type:complete
MAILQYHEDILEWATRERDRFNTIINAVNKLAATEEKASTIAYIKNLVGPDTSTYQGKARPVALEVEVPPLEVRWGT